MPRTLTVRKPDHLEVRHLLECLEADDLTSIQRHRAEAVPLYASGWDAIEIASASRSIPTRFTPSSMPSIKAAWPSSPREAEGDIVNCESVPDQIGSLSVSSYSPHSTRAIHSPTL